MHSTAVGAELPLFPMMKIDLSRRDKRNYRFHELKNGLRLLLVSDSANGLKQDDSLNPVSLPTMLLAEYNGYSGTNFGENAKDCKIKTGSYVTYEYSCFFFELEPDRIQACLELFAKTLTKPLLPEKLIEAQIDEIDNDYRKCKLREYAMLQQFVCHLSTEDSPFNRFHKDTLNELESLTLELFGKFPHR
ncbi:unnamed protein product [Dicrocoelium dendriticum]|nr:unnamed protein product [Dicrocoelium dendriticum]